MSDYSVIDQGSLVAPAEAWLKDAGDVPAGMAPEGFRPIGIGGPFIAANGPIYMRQAGNETDFGLRVQEKNCNIMRIAHGGWLATLADMILPLSARLAHDGPDTFLLTVSLSLDFLGPAPLGCWIEGRGEVLRRTKRLVFVQGNLTVDGAAIVRASGIFRIGPLMDPAADGRPAKSATGNADQDATGGNPP